MLYCNVQRVRVFSCSLLTSAGWLSIVVIVCCHFTATLQSAAPGEHRQHSKYLLYSSFVWVVDDAKCILVTRICVSVCPSPHSHTTARVPGFWGNGRGAPSCALLSGFAIGARVSLLWQHSANAKCQRVPVVALWLVLYYLRMISILMSFWGIR